MKIEEVPFQKIEAVQWDSLLERSGSASPFSRYAWLRLIAEAYPQWRVSLLLASEGDRLLGGLPCVESAGRFSIQSHVLPWGTPAGLVLAPGAGRAVAEGLIGQWVGQVASGWRPYRLAITFTEARPSGLETLERRGFDLRLQHSLQVTVAGRTREEWEASLGDSVRNQNRQAVRRGAKFHNVTAAEEAPELYRLAGLTSRRHRRPGPLLSERFYSLLLDPSGPLADTPGLAQAHMVRVNGAPAAFSICLLQGRKLWLWDYGADESLFAARPNNHMYHQVICSAFEQGLDSVELGVVPEEAFSLSNFKRGFGGVPYERLTAVYLSPLFRLGIGLRAFCLHRFRRR
jgi:predicted N-acyltransferase